MCVYMSRLHERRLRGIDQQVGGRCSLQPCGESFVAEAAQLHAAQHADRDRRALKTRFHRAPDRLPAQACASPIRFQETR